MDIFNFCWMTLLNESKKCSVFFDKNTCNVKNSIDQNFTKPVNRIAYLYKFGSYNISFFHQCFKEFFSKVPDSSKIVDDFRAVKNLTICSMSAGPGNDIIGLLYSLYVVQKPLINSTTFRVISKDGNWRSVVTEMINSSIISVPDGSACHLIGCNFLKKLSKKAQNYLKAADILLMCDSFSSSGASEKKILQATIELLKPGVLVFLIFSEEKSNYFKELESFGSFLYGPVKVILENMLYNEKIAELVGVKPLCSGTSMFAVWQKFHKVPDITGGKEIENNFDIGTGQLPSTKLSNNKCEVKDNYPILSMSGLKGEFPSDTNTSSNDNITNSSHFSSSSIFNESIKRKDKQVLPNNSANFNTQDIGLSEMHLNSSGKNVSSVSLNTSDSLIGNKYASSCESGQKEIESTRYDINSLLKNFENLITNFDRFINSQDSFKNAHVKQNTSSHCQHCTQKLHQDHYLKSCQFNKNGLTCCHSMVCDNINVGIHNCSLNGSSNLCKTLSQEGPCIVIPLQNLSNESLDQILSILSQNCISVNKTSTSFPKEQKG